MDSGESGKTKGDFAEKTDDEGNEAQGRGMAGLRRDGFHWISPFELRIARIRQEGSAWALCLNQPRQEMF